jgi:hypothetical protein
MTVLIKLSLVVAGLVCVVSHALGIEAGHEFHQAIFLTISTYQGGE